MLHCRSTKVKCMWAWWLAYGIKKHLCHKKLEGWHITLSNKTHRLQQVQEEKCPWFSGHLCPEKLWLPHLWKCWSPGWMGLGANPFTAGGWNSMVLKVLSNTNRSLTPRSLFLSGSWQQKEHRSLPAAGRAFIPRFIPEPRQSNHNCSLIPTGIKNINKAIYWDFSCSSLQWLRNKVWGSQPQSLGQLSWAFPDSLLYFE